MICFLYPIPAKILLNNFELIQKMIETPNNAQNGRANVINWRFHIDIPINAIMMATISMEDGNLASVSVNALRMVPLILFSYLAVSANA